MSSKLPTLLFVPGSWLSTDIYRSTAVRLPEYRSVVIDQPTNKMRPASVDMHEDIEHTRMVIENELQSGNDVVIIAHSAGGVTGCLGAHNLSKTQRLAAGYSTGVVGYIGVASILPYVGKTIMDMNAEFWMAKQNALAAELGPPTRTFDQIAAAYKFNEDYTVDVLEPEYLFYSDLTTEEAKPWIGKHETQSGTLYNLKTPENPITDQVPSYYILAMQDNAIPACIQDEYALQTVAGNRENIFKLASDHVPHLSHPMELEDLLRKTLKRITGSIIY